MNDPTIRAAWLEVFKAGITPLLTTIGVIAAALIAKRKEAGSDRTTDRRKPVDEPTTVVQDVRADDPQSLANGLIDLAGVVSDLSTQMGSMRQHYEREIESIRKQHTADIEAQERRHMQALEELRQLMQRQIDRGTRRIQQLIGVMQDHNIPIPPEEA